MKKFKAIVCATVGAILLLTGCSGGGGKSTELHMACFPNITHAQALVMKNRQTLEKELEGKYDVTWTTFTAGSSEVEALFAGEIDIGYIGPVPAVNGNVKSHGDLTVIAGAADAGAVMVKAAGSDITDVASLDGKTVAIPQIGNTQHLCLLALLSENGLAPVSEGGTVEVVAVDNSNLRNMFDQGNVDAALVPEPWGTILTAADNVDLMLDYEDIYLNGDYPVALVVVRNEFLEEHPDAVEAFLKAHAAVTEEINTDLDGTADAMIEEIDKLTGGSFDKDIVLSAFSRTKVTTGLNEEALAAFAETSYEQGFITDLPGEGFVDLSLISQILRN